MPKIPAENPRPEARGKENPPGPGVGRRTGRGLKVWGPLRPRYPPMSANGPQGKTSGWRWLHPSNSCKRASRVPRDMRVSRSPFHPCQKHTGTPGTPLGPGGNKKYEVPIPNPYLMVRHDTSSPMAPRNLHLTTISKKEPGRGERDVTWSLWWLPLPHTTYVSGNTAAPTGRWWRHLHPTTTASVDQLISWSVVNKHKPC